VPDIKAQVGATDAELGIAFLFAGVGAIPAMLVAGRLWRRFGWWLLPVFGLIFAATMLTPIAASTPLTLAIAAALLGAGSGALDVSMNAAVSDVEAERGARLMFGAHAMFSLAVLVAAVATGFARQLGAQPGLVLGSVALFTTVVALGSISSARKARALASAPDASASPKSGVAAIAFLAGLCAAAFLVEDAVANWSALHLERGLGVGPALGGAAPGIFAGAMFVGRAMGQRLGDRFSERILLSGGALVAAAGTAMLALAPVPAVALIGLALAGGGISMVAPALFARAGRLAGPAGRGAAIARVTSIGYTGFIIGPALVGLLAQATDLRTAIGTLALLSLGVAIGGWLVMGGAGEQRATFEEGEELLRTSRG
jgi:MFS family permease